MKSRQRAFGNIAWRNPSTFEYSEAEVIDLVVERLFYQPHQFTHKTENNDCVLGMKGIRA